MRWPFPSLPHPYPTGQQFTLDSRASAVAASRHFAIQLLLALQLDLSFGNHVPVLVEFAHDAEQLVASATL